MSMARLDLRPPRRLQLVSLSLSIGAASALAVGAGLVAGNHYVHQPMFAQMALVGWLFGCTWLITATVVGCVLWWRLPDRMVTLWLRCLVRSIAGGLIAFGLRTNTGTSAIDWSVICSLLGAAIFVGVTTLNPPQRPNP